MVDGTSSGEGAGCYLDGMFLILRNSHEFKIKAVVTDGSAAYSAHLSMELRSGRMM